MITQEEIHAFIEKIPPTPAILKQTMGFVIQGELTKAAKTAEGDPALKSYLITQVNKPIYGFRNEVHDLSQIFGILGISAAQQTLYNYMMSLLSPAKWELFDLNKVLFYDLQASLSTQWQKILLHLNIENKEIETAITLLPASIITCEALFKTHLQEVTLLRSFKALDYNTILKRLGNLDLFDICETIAHKWELSPEVSVIIQASSGLKPANDEHLNTLGKWMHLLLFYQLSQSAYIKAGLNDFIDFQTDYVQEIYEEFNALIMEVS